MKKSVKMLFGVVATCAVAVSSYALTINDPGVVGTVEYNAGLNANVDTQTALANYLLSLGANTTSAYDSNGDSVNEQYATGNNDYNAVLSGGTKPSFSINNGQIDVSSYEWVLVKYDGPNAGYVLFNVADAGGTIPAYPATLWTDNTAKYAISGFVGFGGSPSVPDGGSTVAMLGFVMVGAETLRRKLRRS